VPLAAWFRRQGATVVLVPAEQSADLRAYYAKHTKTDRLDAELLARLPLLHPDGLHPETTNGPGDPLKRAVKLRSGLVRRRSACMQRLDALLEILGPDWVAALGSDMTQTAFRFLAGWANPHQVKRLGRARLARWFQRQTRKAWGERRADAVVSAAEATLALWGPAGMDYEALAADIATEASLALELSRQIARLDERIFDHYCDADPEQLLLSVPGVGKILAAQIRGRLGDPHRFTSLAAARSFSGLIPHQHSSGLTNAVGGPTKPGDACLREALFLAADHARKTDPTLPPATSGSCARPAATTPRRCAPSPPCCSPGSLPACVTAPPTRYATSMTARSPPPRAERSSPSATRSHPRFVPPVASSATPAAATAGGTSASSKESPSAPR
jgi:transposase